jgi:lipopolysaccharide biosynthesis protein
VSWRSAADDALTRLGARIVSDPERLVVAEHVGAVASDPTKSACVFAHYDPAGCIEDYVAFHVKALAALGLEVVFVSTAEAIAVAELAKILPYTSRVLVRRNVGLDFGSWKTGLARIADLTARPRLVLTNDSVFGPFRDLAPIFAEMERRGLDLWGMTTSDEIAWHVQSYFLVFERRLLSSAEFGAFWDDFRFYLRKPSIIRNGEIGLSQRMRERGFAVGAFVDGGAVRSAAGTKADFQYPDRLDPKQFNATLFAWDLLLRDFGFPFLKTELLRQNRFASVALASWRDHIRRAGPDYDVALVERSRNTRVP